MKIALGVLFFTIGNILAWFQFNSQFVWDGWKDKAILSNLIFAIPMGLCFWYAIKYIVEDTGALWTSKLVGFGVSNIVFAILTYIFLKEGILVAKTLICLSLSVVIVWIQIMWK